MTTTASEYNNSTISQLPMNKLAHSLLDYKIQGLAKGLIIPDDLIAELESYAERNPLHKLVKNAQSKKEIMGCCPRCLKAHMLKTAENLGISQEGRQFLSLFMQGEAGHNGYYLDADELIKI